MKDNLISMLSVVTGLAMFTLPFIVSLLIYYDHPMQYPVGVVAFVLLVWGFGRMGDANP